MGAGRGKPASSPLLLGQEGIAARRVGHGGASRPGHTGPRPLPRPAGPSCATPPTPPCWQGDAPTGTRVRRSADVCPSQTDRNDGLSDPSSASKAPAAASSHAVPGAPRGHSPPSVREAPPWGTRGPQAPSCSPLASLGISATGSLHAPCKWASPRGCRQPPLGRPQLTGSSGSRTLGAATRRSEWGRGAALGRRGAGSKPWGPRPRGRRHVTRAWLQRRRWEALADVCRLETVSSAGLRKCREWSSDPTCEEFGSRHAVLTSDASTLAPLGPRGAASRKGGEPLLFWGPQSLGSQTASSSSGQLAPNKPGSDPYSQDWGPQLPCSSSAGGASPHPERRSRGGRSRRRGGAALPGRRACDGHARWGAALSGGGSGPSALRGARP